MMAMSDKQKEIVYSHIGNATQVLASAGSGKTRVLTERVRHILSETKRDCVIALTFTHKAAEEMESRLSDSPEAEERAWIATIHSVAQRILEQYSHTISLPQDLHIYERDKDRMEVFMQSLRDDGIDVDTYLNVQGRKQHRDRERVLQKYMDDFSQIKREMFTKEEAINIFPDPELWHKFEDYQNALLNRGGIDYDDILVYAHRLLLTQEWIADVYRARYKHICVDEAQDLNRIQYEFIKTLCGEKITSVMMVGDEHQMIYGFNGSSSEYLCEYFIDDFKPIQYELKKNYRSTKAVIHVANKLKPDSQVETDFALEGDFNIHPCTNEYEEAQWIINSIKNVLEQEKHPEIEGNISLDHMVVIARNRFVFTQLEKELKSQNIPYTLRKGERREEPTSLFGRVLDYAIRLKLNPKDWVDGKKLCSLLDIIPPNEWNNTKILKSFEKQIDNGKVDFPELLHSLLQAVDELDVDSPNIRKFVNIFKEQLEILAESEIEEFRSLEIARSIDELGAFRKCWSRFKQKGLGESLLVFRNAMALGQLNENRVKSGLTLSTVHSMKGLEVDIVFLMGMCEGVFPDYRANSIKEISEERNNAFVAVTRAKRWLYISYPQERKMPWGDIRSQQKSRFLEEIQSD